MNLHIVKLTWCISDLMVPLHMREADLEATRFIRINSIPWMLSNENLLTNGLTIWPARAKTLAIALGPRGTVKEIAERALQYIEQMTPQVEQMRAPCRDPHTLNTIESTGETYEECERRLSDEDDLPGHRG